ncbi:Serine protease trypsin-like protein [Phytophthora palmivora]|uniref:Serine protease trypsin-like protein n=1 Tax=Phytophthora palmivora TaxID=4796 RepID=A0A2P4XM16_9STRA|nr:Serine protease trypsin-like protein [Phytophthora palmivora]
MTTKTSILESGGSNDGSDSDDLKRVKLQLKSDEECTKVMKIDDTMACEDVLIGVVTWKCCDGCAKEGFPGVFGRASRVRAWIESFLNRMCFK